MLPTITVITPSLNQGKFIQQTVESVLSQNYPYLEYIVVDGLSTDNTVEVLTPYENRLTLIREKDTGQADAINKGLYRATGDIVCWLNSDDYLLPDALLAVGHFFANHPTQLWLTGDCVIVDTEGAAIQQPIRHYKRLLRSLSPLFYLGVTNAICQPATFWRRVAHNHLGYLDEFLRYTMDYDWWLRLRTKQAPAIISQPLTAFRIHEQSKGGSEYEGQFGEDYEVLQRHIPSRFVQVIHRAHNQLITSAYKLLK